MKSCGVVFGIILVLLFYLQSVYTGRLIVRIATELNGGLTYAQMAKKAFGNMGVVLVESFIIIFTVGACVGSVVII
jgi:amino acid permease